MLAEALLSPLSQLDSLQHNAAAACVPAQEEAKSDVSMPHRQAGRRAAPFHIGGAI